MAFSPGPAAQARFVDAMTENIVQAIRPATAPRNIQGEVFPVCLHCAGMYFSKNKFLFIDHKATIEAQDKHGT
eukprot:3805658-Prorocentrum_lima.AAC.1